VIGLLNAYRHEENAPPYQREYGPMCMAFLNRTFPDTKVAMYDVGLGKLPKSVNECDLWIITGSPKAAYGKESWIKNLGLFVQESHKSQRKMIGICFGHQLIAHYLGGKTESAASGWGVGVQTFDVIANKPWMKPPLKQISLIFSHQDQVVKLPTGAVHLAEDTRCIYQMYSIGNHIFCLQGHPEFTAEFARGRYDSRVATIGQEKYNVAVESLVSPTNSFEVGQWMRAFCES
jgi:GMP synthase-like glutamine amidotransferase